jgi:hypothetical protein
MVLNVCSLLKATDLSHLNQVSMLNISRNEHFRYGTLLRPSHMPSLHNTQKLALRWFKSKVAWGRVVNLETPPTDPHFPASRVARAGHSPAANA